MKIRRLVSIGSATLLSLTSSLTLFMPVAHATAPNVVWPYTFSDGTTTATKSEMDLTFTTLPANSTVSKLGLSQGLNSGASHYVSFANLWVDNTGTITAKLQDSTDKTAFNNPGDFQNLLAGATPSVATTSFDADATITYDAGSVTAGDTFKLIIDRASDAGWITYQFQVNSGAVQTLGEIKDRDSVDGMAALSSDGTVTNSNWASCSDVTDHIKYSATFSQDGTAVTNMEKPGFGGPSGCQASFDNSTASAGTVTFEMVPYSSLGNTITMPSTDSYLLWNGTDVSQGNGFTLSSSANTSVGVSDTVGNMVALATVDLSSSRDWSSANITVGQDLTTYKSFVHNLATAPGVNGSYTLFVPYRSGDNFVGICPGVTSLSTVSNKCSGIYYLKDGQSKTSKDTKSIPSGATVKASVVTLNAVKYWQISGLTGTGGFSTKLAADPDTGYAPTINNWVAPTAICVALGMAITGRQLKARTAKH